VAEVAVTNVSEFKQLCQDNLSRNVSSALETILAGAVTLNASDLHIEPLEEGALFRARIDGMLQNIVELSSENFKSILSRLKLLSNMKLNIQKQAQDGRFSIITPSVEIEVRSSIIPSQHGESSVLRLLNPQSLISLDDLGLRSDLYNIFTQEINRPNGMVIVTGPTGSGKTTTLYAFLKSMVKPETKIITIEDPIEYHLNGISQTEVNRNYTFASGLRAIVRQDPDVILVGEIRDLETAQIGLQAALTGHLVLSTMHTNDAAGTIARFLALGEKAVNVAPALNMAIAQRLIRLVCPHCGREDSITPEEWNEISEIPKDLIDYNRDSKIMRAVGCEKCNNTGYKGRLGIFEVFKIDEEMERFILKTPSISELKAEAIRRGMITLKIDGLIKVLEKKTTLEEIRRVAG